MDKPLIDKKYKMQKDPRGAWVFIIISEIPKSERSKGGFVKVKGTVDEVEIKSYNLFPMKDGRHFFPIKKDIRKKIGKDAGDMIKVVLYRDIERVPLPAETKKKQPLPKELRL